MGSEKQHRSSRRKRTTSTRLTNIDHVKVDESFSFLGEGNDIAGDGCYVSTLINNKRYYGVLISQDSLQQASDLHFQDEESSLNLNERMVSLRTKQAGINDPSPQAETSTEEKEKQVQKFKYVDATSKTLGYRVILATYANVREAGGGDPAYLAQIKNACEAGGNWVGNYYFQYEVQRRALKPSVSEAFEGLGLHTSMSFNNFLFNTQMPAWYPLKNLSTNRATVLRKLRLTTDKSGGAAKYDLKSHQDINAIATTSRKNLRVGIVGAGLGGLGCAQELLRLAKQHKMQLDVILLEARDRVGGRCCTDTATFKRPDGSYFPIELGASWIHGATGNPLTVLAEAAGSKMRGASDSVKMLVGRMKEADEKVDSHVSKVFDKVLDQGSQERWAKEDLDLSGRRQKTTRFYASLLGGSGVDTRKEQRGQYQKDVASHRFSSDSSVAVAIEKALGNERAKMTKDEWHYLDWNIKHAEYSFSANIEDLSMKFWDADDEYAFKGNHLLLEKGYSSIAKAVLRKCQESGDNFQLHLNHPVGKIEYDLQCYPRIDSNDSKNRIGISDACRITGTSSVASHLCDFVVCALPLGILKKSVQQNNKASSGISFQPSLPKTKEDSIEHVGFGMLNKIYLQFPSSFWRKRGDKQSLKGTPFLCDSENNFGNASGVNPHYYMFFDVGFDPGNPHSPNDPCVLHTLVSGLDAVRGENLSDRSIIDEVMYTLRHLFSDMSVPQPIAYKISRWGSDTFTQGAYSFLPPGSSSQDYLSLQSPVCAKGDAFTVGRSETMRLFFAGEHTSAHYPSLSHGAYISGVRAARDIFSNLQGRKPQAGGDNDVIVPMTRFRMKNPRALLQCQLCNLPRRDKEGELMVFQNYKGRLGLIHRNCAEFSPDVFIKQGLWHNVIKCINRGKQLRCVYCKKIGATIGCNEPSCRQNFHFGCCDPSWSFEKDGKGYYCALHRENKLNRDRIQNSQDGSTMSDSSQSHMESGDSKDLNKNYRTISIQDFKQKNPSVPLTCALCNVEEDKGITGQMLSFDRDQQQALVHENCLMSSNIMEPTSSESSQFINIFEIIEAARTCWVCRADGATIRCSKNGCFRHYHFKCSKESGWDMNSSFFCSEHRQQQKDPSNQQESVVPFNRKKIVLVESREVTIESRILHHDLFYPGKHRHDALAHVKIKKRKREYAPSNEFESRPPQKISLVHTHQSSDTIQAEHEEGNIKKAQQGQNIKVSSLCSSDEVRQNNVSAESDNILKTQTGTEGSTKSLLYTPPMNQASEVAVSNIRSTDTLRAVSTQSNESGMQDAILKQSTETAKSDNNSEGSVVEIAQNIQNSNNPSPSAPSVDSASCIVLSSDTDEGSDQSETIDI